MRLHQKQYQVLDVLDELPLPDELVEEVQSAPYYRIDENRRQSLSGGQFSLTLAGEGVFQTADTVTTLTAGVGFLALHGEKDVSYYYPPRGDVPWRFLWMSFSGVAAEQAIRSITWRYGHIFRLNLDCSLVKELLALVRSPGIITPLLPGTAVELSSRVLGALLDSQTPQSRYKPDNLLLTRFQEFVLENIRRDFGVQEVADTLAVSREHLSRVIAGKLGMAPAAYIREKRMREARHLLHSTNLACADIAEKLGYSSPTTFSRTFKLVTGISPERYRKRHIGKMLS